MPHFFVDDGFSDSKEVLSIPARHRLAAVGLWTLCGAWCMAKLTDGFIPDEALKRLGARPALVDELIAATLWERVPGGIRFTNWPKWQRTREQVESYRAWDAERKRERRRRGKSSTTSGDDETSPRDSYEDKIARPQGTPTTPVPVPITTHLSTDVALGRGSGGRASTATGHRLPDGWMPPQPVVAQMRSDHPHVDLKSEHEKFVDYWRAQPGAKGRKVDWPATWRNWIRRAAEQAPRRNGTRIRPSKDDRLAELQAKKSTNTTRLEIE